MKSIFWPEPSDDEIKRIDGRLVPDGECRLWPGWCVNGYGSVQWKGKRWLVHRLILVWASDCLEYSDLMAIHRCRNKNCAAIKHVRWGNQTENMRDAKRDGTAVFGESHVHAKLTSEDVIKIWNLYYFERMSMTKIAAKFPCSRGNIQQILEGGSWKWVTGGLTKPNLCFLGENSSSAKLTNEQVYKIWDLYFREKLSLAKIAKILEIKNNGLQKIVERRTWVHLTKDLPTYNRRKHSRKPSLGFYN